MPTLEQIARRIDGLDGTFAIKLDVYGHWYATCDAEIKRGAILGSCVFHADSIQRAVEGLWEDMVLDLPKDQYIVVNAGDPERRRHYRWDHIGQLWKEIHNVRVE